MRSFKLLFVFVLLASCISRPPASTVIDRIEAEFCQTETFKVDADFSGANMASCAIVSDRTIAIVLKPEDVPINHSPWYAVRLTPHQAGDVQLVLRYEEHPHRYKPKTSVDGESWTLISDDCVNIGSAGFEVTLKLTLDSDPVFVSAQELITNEKHDAWMDAQATLSHVDDRVIGTSIENRPIRLLETNDRLVGEKTVLLVGRQHPPEVTGAFAMRSFTDEVLGTSELARTFRAQFKIYMIPNLNPDGVEHGHWRHNLGGIDLNRDWGPFTQPETQAAKTVIDAIQDDGLKLFLDFHSTSKNVFYTQPLGNDGTEYDFTAQWLERAGSQLEDYPFDRQGAHNVDLPTSKNYIFERFGIPAITYELGDNTDREQIAETARIFAQEMMILLLEEEGA